MFAAFSKFMIASRKSNENNVSDCLEKDGLEFVKIFYTQLNSLYKMEKAARSLLAKHQGNLNNLNATYQLAEQTMADTGYNFGTKVALVEQLASNSRTSFNKVATNVSIPEIFSNDQFWECRETTDNDPNISPI